MAEIDFAKVKRNIGRMIDHGAPEADIEAYVASEGTSADALRSASMSAPIVQAPATIPGAIDNTVRQLVKGIPILGGAMENIAAAGDAATYPILGRGAAGQSFSDRYAKNLPAEQARDAAFESAHPIASTALNVGGAIAGTLPLAATAIGARALGLVGSTGVRVVQGGLGGTGIGAADAVTRGQHAGVGAGVGGVVGMASPLIGRAAGAVVNRVAGATQEGVEGFVPNAVTKVARAMTDDAVDPAALQRLGPHGMLVDMGPNLRSQGEALATQPGSASRIVGDAVTNRFQAAPTRITQGVDDTLGPYQNFRQTQDAAIASRRASGNAAYGQAFENARPVDVTPAVVYIDDVVRPGLSRHATGGPAPDSIEGVLGRVRNVLAGGNSQRIDARKLHVVKMDLDDDIEAALRNGRNNQARVLIDVRDRVVSGMDDATDGLYATARRQFRSDSAVINALDDGRDLFKKSTRPDDVLALVREMPEAERHAFRIGARDAIDEVMGTARNDALAARTLFGKDWNRQKLTAVVGRERAEQLLGIIEREDTFAGTYAALQRGSQTRGRLAAGAEFPNKIEVGNTPGMSGRTVLGTAEEAFRGIINKMRSTGRTAALEQESADAARMLTADGPARDRIVQAVIEAGERSRAVQPLSDAVRDIATIVAQSQREPLRITVQPRR